MSHTPNVHTNLVFEDPNGKFLADYDVRVTCRPIANEVHVGTFGLKSVDQ
jgi:hypothetical protein